MMLRYTARRFFASGSASATSSSGAGSAGGGGGSSSKASKKGGEGGGDTRFGLLRKTLELSEYVETRTADEFASDAKAAKEWTRERSRAYMNRRKEEGEKLKMKIEAVEKLPEPFRSLAKKDNHAVFPANKHVWTLTPPIAGFREQL
ncbi:mitochondrial ribosomal protein L40 (mL40) [Andalucia godoyi]|uniref:Mitochondrial ribosomal protein L40 (ML40) n=1 Tax=Andalucia godoyi TaxID=505711 RepID=A0A8K0AHX9_ANDGO|nr:mitochondrial ribosomal protein L40 (mL40) [Andalucia godoyi]|eukprot:ANDGO_08783.mRNA.1 mitochondrial ribosomal protein L40 (mL40)